MEHNKKLTTKFKRLSKWFFRNKSNFLILIIFLFELFLRFYQMDLRNPFGYDQVDNAWAAKNILVDHKYPLVGMAAKGNSGIYLGPLYYYLVALFYFLTNLNPIASGILAGLTSVFTFWVIFFVVKKLFSQSVAIIAILINTFVMQGITFDRIQWNASLIPSVSLLIFYILYKVLQGDSKKIIYLAILVGIFFSIHITAIFFPIIILLTLPFFPRNKETLKYILISTPLFLIWLVPNIVYQLQQKSLGNLTSYFQTYYHGFHLKRVMQLASDGLVQFNFYLFWNPYEFWNKLEPLKFLALPIFFLIFLYKSVSKQKILFCYLIVLWFVIPWFVLSTYSGEISDYYFSINRFIALFIISYFLVRLWSINNILPKIAVFLALSYVVLTNLFSFLNYNGYGGLTLEEKTVQEAIKNGKKIQFQQGVPESYLYYYYYYVIKENNSY